MKSASSTTAKKSGELQWNWGLSISGGLQTDEVKATVNASHSQDNGGIRAHSSFQVKPQREKEQMS